MLWFKNKGKIAHAAIDRKSTIEIISHKKAEKEVIDEFKKVNKQLNKALAGNGFTVKIFLAAGGKTPTHTIGTK